MSELFRILNPLSFVTTAVEVIEANPVNVVALLPRATPVLPMVNELFARLLLAIEDAVVRAVPVSAGKVIVTSAVAAGPFKVTEFVPLSVSSLKIMLPAELEDPVRVGAVRLLFVKVSVPVVETNVAFETAVLNWANVPVKVLFARFTDLFVKVSEPVVVARVASVTAVLNWAIVPDIVFDPRAKVLFVRVSELF